MKIYQKKAIDGFMEIQLNKFKEDIIYVERLKETGSITKEWKILKSDIITKGKKSDTPYFWADPSAIVISKKAKRILEDYCNENKIELLPIEVDNEQYYVLHLMEIMDVEYEYEVVFGGKKVDFNYNQLSKVSVEKKGVFRGRVKGKAMKHIFFTDTFIDIIRKSDLKGWDFRVVWEFDKGNVNERIVE